MNPDQITMTATKRRWMMKRSTGTLLMNGIGLVLCIGLANGVSFAEENTPGNLGQALSYGSLLGISDADRQGTFQIGNADVDVTNEIVTFEVGSNGQEQGAQLEEGTLVQGLLICNKSAGNNATVVSTPPVPVQANGTAQFSGNLSFPSECKNQSQLGFMIQILNPETEI